MKRLLLLVVVLVIAAIVRELRQPYDPFREFTGRSAPPARPRRRAPADDDYAYADVA